MKTEEILVQLSNRGFETKKDVNTKNCHYHVKKIGIFSVYIYISTKFRVIIETAGKGKYYIILSEVTFNKSEDLDVVIEQFKKYSDAVEQFQGEL